MEERAEARMMELLKVVAWLSEKYTGGASSSVTYEKAQELMEAVLYCIREYEQEQACRCAPAAEGGLSVEEAYKRGYELVVRKGKKMRAYYNWLSERFCSYGCQSYEEAFRRGLPEFFHRYDPRFAPHKTLIALDYSLLLPLGGLNGIDAIEHILSCLSLEQKFMGAFDEGYVRGCLSAYGRDDKEPFFNPCGALLQDVLLCILMKKPLSDAPTKERRKRLSDWQAGRTGAEAEKELRMILLRLVEERFSGNERLYEYLCGGISGLSSFSFASAL